MRFELVHDRCPSLLVADALIIVRDTFVRSTTSVALPRSKNSIVTVLSFTVWSPSHPQL